MTERRAAGRVARSASAVSLVLVVLSAVVARGNDSVAMWLLVASVVCGGIALIVRQTSDAGYF